MPNTVTTAQWIKNKVPEIQMKVASPHQIRPKNKIKKLKKQKYSKQAEQNEKKKGLQHVGAGREKRRQEEQLSRSPDVQGTNSAPRAEPRAEPLVSLTTSLHAAVNAGRETWLHT